MHAVKIIFDDWQRRSKVKFDSLWEEHIMSRISGECIDGVPSPGPFPERKWEVDRGGLGYFFLLPVWHKIGTNTRK